MSEKLKHSDELYEAPLPIGKKSYQTPLVTKMDVSNMSTPGMKPNHTTGEFGTLAGPS